MQRFTIPRPGASLAILFGTFFFFLCIFSFAATLLMPRISDAVTSTRILTLFQAIFLFIIPAIVTAMLSTRLPATFLGIDKRPHLHPTLLLIAAIIVAVPAMNMIIEWNAGMHLPDSLKPLEDALRELEDNAAGATTAIMGSDSIGSLIVTIMIVGIMAGLSEELFFRGAMQRIFGATRLNRHAAVWITAIIFSAIHFQFFGFVPRLLLGAFFGYILLWGDNLWYCIIAHATNNTLATLAMWHDRTSQSAEVSINSIGQATESATTQWLLVTGSIILTSIALTLLYKQLKKHE